MAMLQSSVDRTVMQNSAIRDSCWKKFIKWCYHNYVNWRNNIYNGHTEKPKESLTVRNCSNQEERRRDKTLVHTVNI